MNPKARPLSALPLAALLTAALVAHPGPIGPAPALASPAPAGSVPASLRGQWRNGSVSDVGWYNPRNGSWDTGQAIGHWLELKADGTYARQGAAKIRWESCVTFIGYWHEGVAKVVGNRIEFTPTRSSSRLEDSCRPEKNWTKTNFATPETKYYSLDTVEGNELLRVKDKPEDEALTYSR